MVIIYDDKCPMCASYLRHIRLKKSVGEIKFFSARSLSPHVIDLNLRGYDLNAGMVVAMNGAIYHGPAALHVLGLLTTNSTIFNRLNKFLFSRSWIAKLVYPLFRIARRLILWVKNIKPIE